AIRAVRDAEGDERQGPFLPKRGYEEEPHCNSNRSPPPFLNHSPCPQVVLPQSRLSPPHLHRTAAYHRGPLGTAHPAARPAPGRPRRGARRDGWGAPRPRLGPRGEPQHSAPRTAPAVHPGVPHTHPAGGGRLPPPETAHLWHHPGRSGAPPARGPAA